MACQHIGVFPGIPLAGGKKKWYKLGRENQEQQGMPMGLTLESPRSPLLSNSRGFNLHVSAMSAGGITKDSECLQSTV